MQEIARILSAVVSVYMLLIFVRIILTWFSGVNFGKPYQVLSSITDPYLYYFRRFRFLQAGALDFSPIAGLLVLVVLLNMFNTLALYGKITVGIILAIILRAVWSAASFLLTLFIILIVIRFIASLAKANTVHPFIRTIDYLITPLLNWIHKTFFKKRFLTLQTGLAIAGASLLVLSIAGNIIVSLLVQLFQSIPF